MDDMTNAARRAAAEEDELNPLLAMLRFPPIHDRWCPFVYYGPGEPCTCKRESIEARAQEGG
jgi:hypothetical protein